MNFIYFHVNIIYVYCLAEILYSLKSTYAEVFEKDSVQVIIVQICIFF